MTLGILVSRFSDFVREQPLPPEPVEAAPPPAELERLHDLAGHHLVLLMILARADGSAASEERRVIVDHFIALAEAKGGTVSEADEAALAGYVAQCRPSLVQLDPALKRLHQDSHEDVADLVAAAQMVVDADGERRPAEIKFLAQLQDDLDRL